MIKPTVPMILTLLACYPEAFGATVPDGPTGKVTMRTEILGEKYKMVLTREE